MASLQSILDHQNDTANGIKTETQADEAESRNMAADGEKDVPKADWQERYKNADITKRERKKEPKHYVSVLSLVIVIAAILISVALMFSYTRITVLNDQIAKSKTELETLQNEAIKLKTQYEARYNLTYIEEYAQKKLGMTKLDNSQIEYIEINNPDTVTRVTGEGFSFSLIGDFFTNAVNVILDIFE